VSGPEIRHSAGRADGRPDPRPGDRRRRIRTVGPILTGAAIFLGAWQLLVVVGGYPKYILPGPLLVAARFASAWTDGTMLPNATTTLVEVVLGFVVGATAALVVGWLLARSRLFGLVLSPYLVAAQSTPILALSPLLVLWFGSGLLSKVVVCALIVFFPVAVATLVGLRSVDPRLVELARSLRATRRQLLLTLEMPSALPGIMGGMRVGVTLAVVGAVVAEWAGGERGLGVLINLAKGSLFDIPLLFATLLTLAIIGMALYGLTVLIERRLVGQRAGG
jgi:NitT/TauT family transport system permease protein